MAIGPRGIGLLSNDTLTVIDTAVPVGIAALGMLLGLGVGAHREGDHRRLAAAAVDVSLTAALVGLGIMALAQTMAIAAGIPLWTFALMAGVCAATSLALPEGTPSEPGDRSSRVIELEGVAAVVAGGVLLAIVREQASLAAVSLIAQASAAALVLATAGWLLLTRTRSETEQRVFTIATVLLVGGAADFLSLSALLGGLIAGLFWQRAGGEAREQMRRDVRYVQHPLLVLILVAAGARVEMSAPAVTLAVAYTCLRTAARTAAGWIGARAARSGGARHTSLTCLPPGVFGVAFTLNAVRAVGPEASMLLAVAVLGTIGADLVARLVTRGDAPA